MIRPDADPLADSLAELPRMFPRPAPRPWHPDVCADLAALDGESSHPMGRVWSRVLARSAPPPPPPRPAWALPVLVLVAFLAGLVVGLSILGDQ